jgi:hypothetical protein
VEQLQNLSNQQIEVVLSWLYQQKTMPRLEVKDLPDLSPVEWYLMEQLLDQLLLEKLHSPLH